MKILRKWESLAFRNNAFAEKKGKYGFSWKPNPVSKNTSLRSAKINFTCLGCNLLHFINSPLDSNYFQENLLPTSSMCEIVNVFLWWCRGFHPLCHLL
jgi:hypothetical protein